MVCATGGRATAAGWPTSEQLQRLTEMNAMPATFTLQPGEYVHINKGRLHAFLKVRPLLPAAV